GDLAGAAGGQRRLQRRAAERRHVAFLGQVADTDAFHGAAFAVVGRDFVGQQFHQRALAAAVAPDEGDAGAAVDGEIGILEQRRAAEGEVDVTEFNEHDVWWYGGGCQAGRGIGGGAGFATVRHRRFAAARIVPAP